MGIVQPKVNELHAQPASVLTSDIVPETSKLYPFYGVFWMMVNTLATVGIVPRPNLLRRECGLLIIVRFLPTKPSSPIYRGNPASSLSPLSILS